MPEFPDDSRKDELGPYGYPEMFVAPTLGVDFVAPWLIFEGE